MKTLIICISVAHGNTKKIAKVMADVLKAKLIKPDEVKVGTLDEYDLIGLGSGIYDSKHHKILLNIVDEFPKVKNKKAFVFSTGSEGTTGFHRKLNKKLMEKGYAVEGEFACKGFDTHGLLGFFIKKNEGRPNREDLENAKLFAVDLKKSD